MQVQKTSFYQQDSERFMLRVVETAEEPYNGVDRRMGSRRQGQDRRIDVRFNLTKSDRRESTGRRKEDLIPERF